MNKNIKDAIFLISLVLVIFFISFRNIIFNGLYIGHTWDWGYPLWPSQIKKHAESIMLYLWNDSVDLGIFNCISKSLFLFGLYNYIFHFLGGVILQKALLIFIFVFSAYSFYLLTRFLSFKRFSSFITSIFYAFSPLAYSRIIAGHLVYLISYAFFPLFVLILLKYFLNANDNCRKGIIYLGLITAILAMHISFFIIAVIIFSITIVLKLLWDKDIKMVSKTVFYTAMVVILLNAFWIIAYIHPLFFGSEIPRILGLSANLGKITYGFEMAMRSIYLKSASQSIGKIIRGMADNGLHTEFVFPINNFISHIGFALSFFIPAMAFSTLLIAGKKDRNFWFFILVSLLGITISSGVRNPIGYLIYEHVFKRLPLLYTSFSNPNRFMPLIYISYPVLLGYFLQASMSQEGVKGKMLSVDFYRCKKYFVLLVILLIIYPFWSGDITKPLKLMWDQTLSLVLIKPKIEEKKVYEFLEKQKDVRVSYLPAANNSFVGKTDFNFEWSTFFSPLPEFMSGANIKEPLSKYIQTLMVYNEQDIPVKHLGRLFGLAAVKYIVFPEYKDGIIPYVRFEGRTDIQKELRQSLINQKDIVEDSSVGGLSEISIYRNKSVLPLIYGTTSIKVFTGNLEDLRIYFETKDQEINGAYLFLTQIPEDKRKDFIRNIAGIDLKLIDRNGHLQFLLTPEKYVNTLTAYAIFNPNSGWMPLANYWSRDINYAALLDKSSGVYSRYHISSPKLSIEYKVNKEEAGRYLLYGLFYFHPEGGNINIEQDEVNKFMVATNDNHRGYRYIKLGDLDCNEGFHKINILGESGAENAIVAIVAVPEHIDNSIKAYSEKMMNSLLFTEEATDLSPEIEFKKINPTRYIVTVKGARTPFILIFNESFHEGWGLFNGNKKEVMYRYKFTPFEDLRYLFKKPLKAEHQFINAYANAWYINPKEFGLFEDFTLSIYFWPQSLYCLGLLISIITLLGCIGYCLWSRIK